MLFLITHNGTQFQTTFCGCRIIGVSTLNIFTNSFFDEFKHQLHHNERGILSMANSGPATNSSQLFDFTFLSTNHNLTIIFLNFSLSFHRVISFILFKSAPHLDNKHTVFGKLVGGFEVLTAMESIPTDDNDRPLVCYHY